MKNLLKNLYYIEAITTTDEVVFGKFYAWEMADAIKQAQSQMAIKKLVKVEKIAWQIKAIVLYYIQIEREI